MAKNKIGSGAYGQVFAYPNGKKAVKLIPVSKKGVTNLQSFIRELDVLRLSNDHLIDFFKATYKYGSVELHLALMDCDLRKRIHTSPLSRKQILSIIKDISYGLHFLHSHSIAHRDLKPSNILVSCEGENISAKLCDFGLSRKFSSDLDRGSDYMVTRWYRAPEVMDITQSYGFAIDMWAFGCVIYEMVARWTLFKMDNEKEFKDHMKRVSVRLNRIEHKDIRDMACALVKEDPKERWDSERCVKEFAKNEVPEYPKSYFIQSKKVTNKWFVDLLNRHGLHERAIMHGYMLFHGTKRTYEDFMFSVYVGYLLYESIESDYVFVEDLFRDKITAESLEINCQEIAQWVCKYCRGPHMLSHYEYLESVEVGEKKSTTVEDVECTLRCSKKRKIN